RWSDRTITAPGSRLTTTKPSPSTLTAPPRWGRCSRSSMANYFVSSASGAGGAGNGSSWANAFLTLAAANAFPIAAGDTLLVGDDHAEWTSGSVTVSLPSFGVSTTPNNIIVVDHTKPSPSIPADLKIGAYGAGSLSASGNINFNFSGYVYGLYVRNGVDAVGASVATNAI